MQRLLLHAPKASGGDSLQHIRVKESFAVTGIFFAVLMVTLLSVDFLVFYKLHQTLIWMCQAKRVHLQEMMTNNFTFPFLVSAAMSAWLGYVSIPLLSKIKALQIFRMEGPSSHFSKVGTPTMGGLFFIPLGVIVAGFSTHFVSREICGLIMATLVFGAIGLLDDVLVLIHKHNYGLPGWLKFFLQVCAGTWFSFWFESANLASPFRLKNVLLLPQPFNHWNLGKWYLPLMVFCFVSMSNAVNLTDGVDGLAAGTAAAAFLGMALAVMRVYPAVGIFGVSMAGACLGFLVHNHHKAVVFMGDTGSLALGGALAAMAACTGMFLPLFIISGIFFVETVSVMLQVFYFKLTKKIYGVGRRLFRMAPLHHHFELTGTKEPVIVAGAYCISYVLALLGGYLGFKISGISLAGS